MTNDEKIAIALKSDYLSELSVYEMLPNSRIRSGFDRRMKKMINESYTDTAKTVRHRRVKLRLAIAVIIAATAALATGGTTASICSISQRPVSAGTNCSVPQCR